MSPALSTTKTDYEIRKGGVRIAVTGIGLVTPLGENFWECVSAGIVQGFKVHPAPACRGWVQGFESTSDRFLVFAVSAADRAVADSGLSEEELGSAGIVISSSKGGIVQGNILNVINFIKCKGPALNVISACATGLNSIIIGANIIKTGRAKVVLAGGVDACLNDFIISGFSRLGVLAKDGICRPYDRNRSGFVLSEGAGVVVLEELNHALKRNSNIYGEISGWASLGDGYHITSHNPTGETIEYAIKICLEKSKTKLNEIDYINTHGTGTKENDLIETKAIKNVFGKGAYNIPLSSTKPVTGHMLGASGAVEFIIGLLAMKNSFIPPTANLDEPDPLCDLDYTPNIGRKHKVDRFLSLSYGFGGHTACIEGSKI